MFLNRNGSMASQPLYRKFRLLFTIMTFEAHHEPDHGVGDSDALRLIFVNTSMMVSCNGADSTIRQCRLPQRTNKWVRADSSILGEALDHVRNDNAFCTLDHLRPGLYSSRKARCAVLVLRTSVGRQ